MIRVCQFAMVLVLFLYGCTTVDQEAKLEDVLALPADLTKASAMMSELCPYEEATVTDKVGIASLIWEVNQGCGWRCIKTIGSKQLRFVEVSVTSSKPTLLEAPLGKVRFELQRAGHPHCVAVDEGYSSLKSTYSIYVKPEHCIAAMPVSAFTSRYSVQKNYSNVDYTIDNLSLSRHHDTYQIVEAASSKVLYSLDGIEFRQKSSDSNYSHRLSCNGFMNVSRAISYYIDTKANQYAVERRLNF